LNSGNIKRTKSPNNIKMWDGPFEKNLVTPTWAREMWIHFTAFLPRFGNSKQVHIPVYRSVAVGSPGIRPKARYALWNAPWEK